MPKMKQLLGSMEDVSCNQLWDKSLNVSDNMGHILAKLGACLEPSACINNAGHGPSSSSHAPDSQFFHHPIFYQRHVRSRGVVNSSTTHQTKGACMFISDTQLNGPSLHQVEPDSYMLVNLGSLKGEAIKEYAHRLVLWAMHGPPTKMLADMGGWGPKGPQCLHVCGNKDCLNPAHLVWGSAQDNYRDSESRYIQLMEGQGRGS